MAMALTYGSSPHRADHLLHSAIQLRFGNVQKHGHINHATKQNARPTVAERRVAHLCGTGCRFAAWHQTTNASLAYLYDAPDFSNVNRFGNILIKLSEIPQGDLIRRESMPLVTRRH